MRIQTKIIDKQKKSQITGEVFIYSLALIVVVLVALLGYKGIQSIRNNANNAQLMKFETTIKSDMSKLVNDYGSIRTFRYYLPSGYSQLCFIKEGASDVDNVLISQLTDEANIFVLDSKNNIKLKLKTTPFEIEGGSTMICFNSTNGNFIIKAEGMGDNIKILNLSVEDSSNAETTITTN